MGHNEALNLMLAHACPSRKHGNLSEFNLDLHCVNARVVAKLTSGDSEDVTYDIVRVDLV